MRCVLIVGGWCVRWFSGSNSGRSLGGGCEVQEVSDSGIDFLEAWEGRQMPFDRRNCSLEVQLGGLKVQRPREADCGKAWSRKSPDSWTCLSRGNEGKCLLIGGDSTLLGSLEVAC